MKIFQILITVLSFNFLCAQNDSGKIIYKAYLPVKKELDSTKVNPLVYRDMQSMIKNFDKIEFELIYNKKMSKFNMVQNLDFYSEGLKLAKVFYGNSEYYFDKKNTIYIKKTQDVNVKLEVNNQWNFTNETKLINGFTCYKATSKYEYVSRSGKEASRDITAWYCPEIPVNYAPETYNGLPGLVLEINTGLIVYVAKVIELNLNNLTIAFPTKNIVSQSEFTSKIKEKLSLD